MPEPRTATDARRAERASPVRVAAAWAGWFAGSWVLWLVLAGSLSTSELIAGAGVAVLAATVAVTIRGRAVTARIGRGELARLGGSVAAVPGDLVKLVRALGRELARRESLGTFTWEPLDPGGDDDPPAIARRTLVPAAESLSPNGYVVGVDRDGRRMLVHRLVADPPERRA